MKTIKKEQAKPYLQTFTDKQKLSIYRNTIRQAIIDTYDDCSLESTFECLKECLVAHNLELDLFVDDPNPAISEKARAKLLEYYRDSEGIILAEPEEEIVYASIESRR